MHRVVEISIPLRMASVGGARNLLLTKVAAAGVALDDDHLDALRICASELITNGIKHSCRQRGDEEAMLLIEGDLYESRRRLRITVTDPGLAVPSMDSPGATPEATGGRGLFIAGEYADDLGWGQRRDAGGDVTGWSVWFELEVQELSLPINGQATAAAEVQPVIDMSRRRQAAQSSASAWWHLVKGGDSGIGSTSDQATVAASTGHLGIAL